jgi:hypothetical protein
VSFYKLFRTAQRRLGIRVRDLYATKDTYVSCALTRGVSMTWLSEQTGVPDATLRKHYGKVRKMRLDVGFARNYAFCVLKVKSEIPGKS